MAFGRETHYVTSPVAPQNANGLAWDGHHLWMCDSSAGIVQFDPMTGVATKTIAVPSAPYALTWDGHHLWTSTHADVLLRQIDSSSGETIRAITMDRRFYDLAWDGRFLWGTDFANNALVQIDPRSGTIIRSFLAPAMQCRGLTFNGFSLWVSDNFMGQLALMATTTGTEIWSILLGTSYTGLTWDGYCLWGVLPALNVIVRMSVN